ncbi:MAG: hypothetical protein Q4G25_06430 [Paracoccus sp. (in: a-proteobacteria)]|nr:hypothetical protein [Paracoccus sp. (in: a-proteobacteria)]
MPRAGFRAARSGLSAARHFAQLDAQDIPGGGRLGGSAGCQTTLLLIDDNGVVHDLRRDLVAPVTGSRFNIPTARDVQPRDTNQILMATATPARLQSVPRLSGPDAERFFAGIAQEAAGHIRFGTAAVYVRRRGRATRECSLTLR